ncbi:hypothetical protein [Mycobacterium genavense]|uniref:hypothetical protein n=1 Tax=Mycobacterium genavense TaxID=36812 RepID=UPI0012EC14EB|nr:hypothetical protein [Mycobacterium genavense]
MNLGQARHPHADDSDYRSHLPEYGNVLCAGAVGGTKLSTCCRGFDCACLGNARQGSGYLVDGRICRSNGDRSCLDR